VAIWDDVDRLAGALPGVTASTGHLGRQWKVADRLVVWERPLGRKDRADLGDAAPEGELLGVRVADLGVKQALLAEDGDVVLDIPHLDGHPVVLVRLDAVDLARLDELVTEAWRCRAPQRLLRELP
jgi:hypothetical protein